jgi:cytochrome c-type biogenesis protein CcmH
MIAFWIAAFLATAAAAALVVLYARRPVAVVADPAQSVYLRQLDEIDDLAARDLIAEDERRTARAEAARRLLGEQTAEAETAPAKGSGRLIGVIVAVIGLVALGAYLSVGRPDMPDQPFKKRLAEWRSQDPSGLPPEQLEAVVKDRLAEKPNDPMGLSLLARVQIAQQDYFSAMRNMEKATALNPDSADNWVLLAELRIELAGNKVTPEALNALQRAIAIDPKLPTPRYLIGRTEIENGRREEGLALWRGLVADLPPQDRETLTRQIASVAAGGPISVAAAGEQAGPPMDPAIKAMVAGLAERLKQNPDDPAGWARLVRSYTVLQDKAALEQALAAARRVFKDRPRDLAAIEAAANVPQ